MAQAIQLKKAQRSKAYLKLGMSGASGSGKTLGALLLAYGLMKELYPTLPDAELWSKIAIIDTENGSGELYVGMTVAGLTIGEYNAITLQAPFEAEKYTTALELCKDNALEVAIIDSTTHLWSGQGGLLEQQGTVAKRTGNSYTAWREVTPMHNKFIDAMLQFPLHVIATMRAKQEYVQEKDEKGRTSVRKLGLEPEQRKGMEFEFTTFLEINADHESFGSKDRTGLLDQKTFKITPNTGRELMKWLQGGVNTEAVVVATAHVADPVEALKTLKDSVIELCKTLGGSKNDVLMNKLKEYTPKGNPNSIQDEATLTKLYAELNEMQATAVKAEVAEVEPETN